MKNEEVLFDIQHLNKSFKVDNGELKAVDDVTFQIIKGETFGLVGESGCGKSTLGRLLVRLYKPNGGDIFYKGESVVDLNRKKAKAYTKQVQMIFQQPYASLNPRMTIGEIIKEGMKIHHLGSAKEMDDRMYELLDMVGLNPEHARRFPYEFSGGQRQRTGIARALAVNPEFIVCDEPISALDVSIQAQIINLLKRLQTELNLTYLFIAHDLSMVRYISDRVGVMYLGSLVEVAEPEELYLNPLHPYTQALISAVPKPDPVEENERSQIVLEGDVPSPINTPKGCKFAGRCKYATDRCRQESPSLRKISDNHMIACHRVEELNHFE
ncbi:MAG: ATP-binding cassette domain-containing protein [Lachnospiraceae bacterium]|nr:ATP-binding cassette domain-containing protein [Lachnospiraceae bacterium]